VLREKSYIDTKEYHQEMAIAKGIRKGNTSKEGPIERKTCQNTEDGSHRQNVMEVSNDIISIME